MHPTTPGLFDSLWHEVTAAWDDVFSNLGDWVRTHAALLRFISATLNMITTIAGLLALIPPLSLIFGAIATLAAGAATLDDLLLASYGEGSWRTVAFDAIGTFAGGAAVKVGGKLANLYAETGRADQTWKLLRLGDKEARVAPGLFRVAWHSMDQGWEFKGSELIWRTISTSCTETSWTMTAIAGVSVPGQIGALYHDLYTGKPPWEDPIYADEG